jgi:adenosylcobinamide-phosphate synthase
MDAPTAVMALAVALALDRWLGEPPAAWHPVVWMGRYLKVFGDRLGTPPVASPPRSDAGAADWGAFLCGAAAWLGGATLFTGAAALLAAALLPAAPGWLATLALGVLLKPMLAWRMLWREVVAVEAALDRSLAEGRMQLSRLCSRDVSQLDAGQVRETALESLSENLNDSVVAPVFWFALGGLPAAVLYRFANTADAMWGYRGVRAGRDWEWAGKWAARADDVLSWLPARLTGLLLVAMAHGAAGGRLAVWRRLPREAARTPSPNSGWPMAAAALVLGVRLGKPGVYLLNAAGRAPWPQDVPLAVALCSRTVAAAALLAATWLICRAGVGT